MDVSKKDDLKMIFDFLDKDRSGGLSKEELQCGLSILRLNLANRQVMALWASIDKNNDEKVDFEEFVQLCVIGTTKDKIKPEELVKRLSPYDKDGSGRMSVADLRLLLGGEGEPLESEDIDDVIRELDIESDGTVDIKEMVNKFLT